MNLDFIMGFDIKGISLLLYCLDLRGTYNMIYKSFFVSLERYFGIESQTTSGLKPEKVRSIDFLNLNKLSMKKCKFNYRPTFI